MKNFQGVMSLLLGTSNTTYNKDRKNKKYLFHYFGMKNTIIIRCIRTIYHLCTPTNQDNWRPWFDNLPDSNRHLTIRFTQPDSTNIAFSSSRPGSEQRTEKPGEPGFSTIATPEPDPPSTRNPWRNRFMDMHGGLPSRFGPAFEQEPAGFLLRVDPTRIPRLREANNWWSR